MGEPKTGALKMADLLECEGGRVLYVWSVWVDVSMWWMMRLSWRRHGREVSSDELEKSIAGRFE